MVGKSSDLSLFKLGLLASRNFSGESSREEKRKPKKVHSCNNPQQHRHPPSRTFICPAIRPQQPRIPIQNGKFLLPPSSPCPPASQTANAPCYQQSTALRSIKSLAPLLDRILVQRIKAEAKTASGIILPESSVKELSEAKVLAVGPGGLSKDGQRIAPSVAPGDKVLIPQVCFLFRSKG
jgi:co-chaperonin GroES (HSP10)